MRSLKTVIGIAAVLAAAYSAAAEQQPLGTPATGAARDVRTVATANNSAPALPAARAEAFTTTINGNALSASSVPLADQTVRLRDARSGRVVASAKTDKAGMFTFRAVDPGSYVVELVGPDRAILAASEILNVN